MSDGGYKPLKNPGKKSNHAFLDWYRMPLDYAFARGGVGFFIALWFAFKFCLEICNLIDASLFALVTGFIFACIELGIVLIALIFLGYLAYWVSRDQEAMRRGMPKKPYDVACSHSNVTSDWNVVGAAIWVAIAEFVLQICLNYGTFNNAYYTAVDHATFVPGLAPIFTNQDVHDLIVYKGMQVLQLVGAAVVLIVSFNRTEAVLHKGRVVKMHMARDRELEEKKAQAKAAGVTVEEPEDDNASVALTGFTAEAYF
jgi:hypothetical protein